MPTPLISVITPCYNHGMYLDEAIASLKLAEYGSILEHIIINDGSTDAFTLQKLEEVKRGNIKLIHQENKGLAAARNAGVSIAKGKYILPLDADNKIIPEVFIEAAEILNNDESIDIVYTDALLFGDKNDTLEPGEFDLVRIMRDNYIDACALIRKSTLLKIGGYDSNMPVMGHEDWDLWINIGIRGGKFYYFKKNGFYYRVLANSMVNTISTPGRNDNKHYIFEKCHKYLPDIYDMLYDEMITNKAKVKWFIQYINKHKIRAIIKIILNKTLINEK
jgi:glycosyltransferase involved in cell wall biosynthesis